MRLTFLNFRDDLIDFVPEQLFACDDFANLGVELDDVDFFARVGGFDVSRHREVVAVFGDFVVFGEMGEMGFFGAGGKGVDDSLDVFLGELVVVRHLDAFV